MIEGPDIVAMGILMGLFMLMAGGLGFLAGIWKSEDSGLASWDRHYFDETDDLPTTPEEQEAPALPVDPTNPPISRIYNPRPGSIQKYCSCHDRPLETGEEVLWWPLPEGQGVRLICADGLAEAKPA